MYVQVSWFRTRKALISILNGTGTGQRPHGERRANDEPNEKKMKKMLRGAIFCLANANWGPAVGLFLGALNFCYVLSLNLSYEEGRFSTI